MSKVGIRGGERVSKKDIKAHLASLLRLENVGIFLGSGASVVAGGKTIKDVWQESKNNNENSVAYLQEKRFLKLNEEEQASPNIEELLDSLEIAKID